jgi:hypothetical protein
LQDQRRFDALVVGAPGDHRFDVPETGFVHVFERAFDPPSGHPAPLPIASFSRSTGGRFGENVVGFNTRETATSEPEHFVVVSSPEVISRGLQQTVWLHQIYADGQTPRLASKSLPDGVREDFGASLAVQIGNCNAACPRDEVWVAIGAPAAKVDKKTAGKVYFWNPWQGDKIADRDLSPLEGFFPRSGYGGALTALRGREAGGGFVIGIPGAEVLDGTGSNGPKGGYVEVRLNKGGAETWGSWLKVLHKEVTGDRWPDNR